MSKHNDDNFVVKAYNRSALRNERWAKANAVKCEEAMEDDRPVVAAWHFIKAVGQTVRAQRQKEKASWWK